MFTLLMAVSAFAAGNPASQFCVTLHGTLERYSTNRGDFTNCEVEEWTLYREMDSRHLVRPISCDKGIPCMPNPAAQNCLDAGGSYSLHEADGYCSLDEWKLYRLFH